jgi:quercetin dioxygenase-like cupin family protein
MDEERIQAHVQPAASSAQQHLLTFDLLPLLAFSEKGPQAQLISESESARLVLFALRAGQEINEHHSPSQLLVQALDGSLVFSAQGQSITLRAGMILQLAANIPHNVHATTDTLMLLTMTPSPAKAHQERDGR